MPSFEYRCEGCGKISEILQKRVEPEEPIKCSCCGSSRIRKIVSAPVVVIKGKSTSNGRTCCGRTERCDTPPCSADNTCESAYRGER